MSTPDAQQPTETQAQPSGTRRPAVDQLTLIILGFFLVVSLTLTAINHPSYLRSKNRVAADRALRAEDYAKAVPYLEQLTRNDWGRNDWWWARERLATCYLILEKPDLAIENAKKWQEFAPTVSVDEYLGAAYFQKGDYAQATEYLGRLLKADPSNAAANFYFGVLKLKQGNLLEAGQGFARASVSPIYDKKAVPYRQELAKRLQSNDAPTTGTAKAK